MDSVASDGEKVLILGAGATRDAATFEGQPAFLPPLDVDFFAIAERIGAEGSVPYDQLVSGLNAIGYASTADLAQHRLEDAFTRLAMVAFGDRRATARPPRTIT